MIREYIRILKENPVTRYTFISGVIPFGGFTYSVLNFNPEHLLPLSLSGSGIICWTAACTYFAPLWDRNLRTLRNMENSRVREDAEKITRRIDAVTRGIEAHIDETIRAIRADGEEIRRQIGAPGTGIDGLLDNT